MFKFSIIVFLYCIGGTSAITSAQGRKETHIRNLVRTYPDTSYTELFRDHPDLDLIMLEFVNKKPTFMTWNLSKGIKNGESIECFDLNFEGDRFVLAQNYSVEYVPALPCRQIAYMDSLQQFEKYFKLSAVIRKDSVTYRFLPPPFFHASYHGDIRQLAEVFEKEYGKTGSNIPSDSVLIFQGIVNRGGSLDNIELVRGEPSRFSDFVKKYLKNKGAIWLPMTKDGRPLRSLIDICVSCDADDKILVSATGRGRKLRIKDYDKETQLFY